MATITTRAGKGSPLTNTELDANFSNLNAEVTPSRATVRPSLLLDFANTRQLDSRIAFTRASTGRFYDGTSVVKAEENLLAYSQEFDNAAWVKGGANITANATTAPDGTTTADLLTETAVNDVHRAYYQNFGCTVGLTYVSSVYVKANGRTQIAIENRMTAANMSTALFDLTAVTASMIGGAGTPSIVSVGNGWYRCSLLTIATNTGVAPFVINLYNTSASYPGDGTSGVYLWGAQLEQRSTVTAYTPTTTAAITNYIPVLQTAPVGVPRFDVDPVTGESKGLLIEEQRTNLNTYSSDFSNSVWGKNYVTVTTDSIVAPDGTLSADKLVEGTTSTQHGVQVTLSVTTGSNTFSVYAKAGERSRLMIATVPMDVVFDLANGTVVSGSGASITPVGNGWYRCSVTVNITTSPTSFYYRIVSSGTTFNYAGDGYSGLYIWGSQAETGSFATSYIPTVASQVTRSADSASMTGVNFSSWFNQAQGTVYAETQRIGSGSNGSEYAGIELSNGSVTQRDSIGFSYDYGSYNAMCAGFINANNTGVDLRFGASPNFVTGESAYKFGFAYQSGNFAGSLNGSAVGTSSSAVSPMPNLLYLRVASSPSSAMPYGTFYGYIKRIAYYPKRLSNSELVGITS